MRLQGVDKVGQPIRGRESGVHQGRESGVHRGSPLYGVEFIMKHYATAADLAWAAAKDQHVVDPRRQRQPDRPATCAEWALTSKAIPGTINGPPARRTEGGLKPMRIPTASRLVQDNAMNRPPSLGREKGTPLMCAVKKVLVSSGCNSHPATGSLQPVAIGAAVEVTKPSEPSRQMCRSGDTASRQAVTRVNVEQASKRPMWSPTLHQYGEGRRRWG